MSKKKTITTLKVRSISFVHDPEAAKKWFEIYVDLAKSELLRKASKKMDGTIASNEASCEGGMND